MDGAKLGLPDAPDQQPVTAHKPCAFCTSSVSVFADANAPRVVAVLEGVPVLASPSTPAELLPRDTTATQPLSPRAPPRLS